MGLREKIKDAIAGHSTEEAISAMLIELGEIGENVTHDRWNVIYGMAKHDRAWREKMGVKNG